MAKYLIVGSDGFMASHLIDKLAEDKGNEIYGTTRRNYLLKDYKIVRIKLDLFNQHQIKSLMEFVKPDFVFQLAGKSTVRENPYDINETIQNNVTITNNVLTYTPKDAVFVYPSSATVYGPRALTSPAKESDLPNPQSIYAASKLACEHLVRSYHNQHKIRGGIIVRLIANVGKGANHGLLPDIIRKLQGENKYLELIGDKPGSIKPFMFVKDTVNAILKIVEYAPLHCLPINISANDSISVEEVAKTVMGEMKAYKKIVWMGEQANWIGDDKIVKVSNHWAESYGINFCSSTDAIKKAVREMV